MYKYDNKYLRYLISKKELNIQDMAEKFKVSNSQMNYKITKGSFKVNEIFKLLEILETSFEELFGEEKNISLKKLFGELEN
jgi:CRISPR/Cas system CSM-associated protein Csm2 small subunit